MGWALVHTGPHAYIGCTIKDETMGGRLGGFTVIERWKTALQALALIGVMALAYVPQPAVLAASVDVVDGGEDEALDGSFPEHGDCTYFGRDRDKYVGVGLAADLGRMQQRAALTGSVMRSLGSSRSSGPRTRGDLFQPGTNPPTGPCSGIDDCIQRTAAAAGVPMADLTTDTEFLRRVTLDLTGRIPAPNEILGFIAADSVDKRANVVEQLLDSPQWADRWAMFFGDLFKNTRVTAQVNRYPNGRDSFHLFLLESLRQNKPYDQMAREMISARGYSDGRQYPATYSSFEHFRQVNGDYATNPVTPSPVAYIVGGRTTGGPIQDTYDSLAFFSARDFLGLGQMDCVLCHDGKGHLDALSVWGTEAKRLEGWGMAAFFADIPRYQTWRTPRRLLPVNPANGRRVNANYYLIQDLAPGRQQITRQGDLAGDYLAQTEGGNRPDRDYSSQFVSPEYPFALDSASQTSVSQGLPLRQQLAAYLTSDRQFARAAVNYIWKEFFSRGIVEPADQFDLARLDPANPPEGPWEIQPSHPELLELLADGFRENSFDLKWLMREITASRTYQLSSRFDGAFNPTNEKYFVRHNVKRLTAEQIHDAITAASGIGATYGISRGIGAVNSAMKFPDVVGMPPVRRLGEMRTFLSAFFPGDREETPRSGEGSPLQALQLMNSGFVSSRINAASGGGTLASVLSQPDDALVTILYLRVLSRMPTVEELALGVQTLSSGDRGTQASNLMWAMLNKTDFYFNY